VLNNAPTVAPAGSGRFRGAADAPVTLMEYGDYQCPTCGLYHPVVTELPVALSGQTQAGVPPLSSDSNASQCDGRSPPPRESAGDQGQVLGDERSSFRAPARVVGKYDAETMFLQYALQLGLDSNRFMQSMKSPDTQERFLPMCRRGNDIVKERPLLPSMDESYRILPGLEGLSDLSPPRLKSTRN